MGLSHAESSSLHALKQVEREEVIALGLRYLQGIGAEHICKVCIAHGGSCCGGCIHLSDGLGCQARNTSCTAWLCGFLKYVMYEAGLLHEWNTFWEQVPGQDFRQDDTPTTFAMSAQLTVPEMQALGRALAEDLQHISDSHLAIGFMITLREKLDRAFDLVDEVSHCKETRQWIRSNIDFLASDFQQFKATLAQYKQEGV